MNLHEVGLRDGLQMESKEVPTRKKLQWLEKLLSSGIEQVQLGSFVHPERVPQMADTDELFRLSQPLKKGKVRFSGLVLNERGLERGLACGVDLFCMGVSASETHSRKNTGMGIDEALSRILAMARSALSSGREVQVSVQSAFGCGYEGEVEEDQVRRIVESYLQTGLKTISLADTAGHADPTSVRELFSRLAEIAPDAGWACHFHDTYGMGLANAMAAYSAGVEIFETAFGGLGGCPFTAVAGGNVCTEDLLHLFQRQGRLRHLKIEPLIDLAREAAHFFGKELPGSVYRVGAIPYASKRGGR